jgi:hypothetical protein
LLQFLHDSGGDPATVAAIRDYQKRYGVPG